MVCNIPKLLKTFNEIKQFTGQEVEKKNNDIEIIHHRKSIKHGLTTESLRVKFRKKN